MDIKLIYQRYLESTDVVIDSRLAKNGCMFFALKGKYVDGHQYAAQAIESGAKYVVIEDPAYWKDLEAYILVKDVLKTMQELSAVHRRTFDIPVIGITGSNGKTTTKELLHEVLSMRYKVHTTKGNYNNHLGVPLTLLAMPQDSEIAVIEMGANHVDEIAELCTFCDPTHGIITNIGKAHLEGFGGIEGVKKGKGELYDYLRKKNGIIFYNELDQHLKDMVSAEDQTIGYNPESFFSSVVENPYLTLTYEVHTLNTRLVGSYNVYNICAAMTIGNYFGISQSDLCKAISSYTPQNNRSQWKIIGSTSYILDAYNANPDSMAESLKSFDQLDIQNKGIILGDMLELGEHSKSEHQRLIAQTQEMDLNFRIFIGDKFYEFKSEDLGKFFESVEEAQGYFDNLDRTDYAILLKGSRGIGVEKIISNLDQ